MLRKLTSSIFLLGCGATPAVKFLVVDSPERKLAQQYMLTRKELVAEQTQSPEDRKTIQQAVKAFQRREQVLSSMETYLNPVTMKFNQIAEPFISSLSSYFSISHFLATSVFYFFIFFCSFSSIIFFYRNLKTQRLVLSGSSPYAATIPHSINIYTSSFSRKHEEKASLESLEELEREIQRLEAVFKAGKDSTQRRSDALLPFIFVCVVMASMVGADLFRKTYNRFFSNPLKNPATQENMAQLSELKSGLLLYSAANIGITSLLFLSVFSMILLFRSSLKELHGVLHLVQQESREIRAHVRELEDRIPFEHPMTGLNKGTKRKSPKEMDRLEQEYMHLAQQGKIKPTRSGFGMGEVWLVVKIVSLVVSAGTVYKYYRDVIDIPEARKDIQAAAEEIRNYKQETDQKIEESMGLIKKAFTEIQSDLASGVKVDNKIAGWIGDIRNQGLPNLLKKMDKNQKQISDRLDAMEVSIRNDIASVRSRLETAMNSTPQQLRARADESFQRFRPDPDNDAPGAVLAGEQLPHSRDASTQTDLVEEISSYQNDPTTEETAERSTGILTGLVDDHAREMAAHMMNNPVEVNQAVIMPAMREIVAEYVLEVDMPLDETTNVVVNLKEGFQEEVRLYSEAIVGNTHEDYVADKGLGSREFLNKMNAPTVSSISPRLSYLDAFNALSNPLVQTGLRYGITAAATFIFPPLAFPAWFGSKYLIRNAKELSAVVNEENAEEMVAFRPLTKFLLLRDRSIIPAPKNGASFTGFKSTSNPNSLPDEEDLD